MHDGADRPTPDAELVLAAMDGDKDAFGELITRHWATALVLAGRLLGPGGLARDAVQEASVTALVGLDRLRTADRFGVGGLLGSFVAPWVRRRFPARRVVVSVGWLWVVLIGVLAVLPNPLSLGVVSGLQSFAAPPFNVVVNTHVYQVTPDRLLGRVRSATRLVTWGSIPLGTLAGGVLASAFGAQTALLILTSVMGGVAAAATFARGMRPLPTTGKTHPPGR